MKTQHEIKSLLGFAQGPITGIKTRQKIILPVFINSILNPLQYFSIFLMVWLQNPSEAYSQACSNPELNVPFTNPTTSITWSTSPHRNRSAQVHSSPNIWMRATWVGRSSSSITLGSYDVSTSYGYAWQPTVNFPSSSSNSDTAWAEFNIEFFSNSALTTPLTLPCLAMTIVDCDGSGSSSGTNAFREMIQISSPVTSNNILGSQITNGPVGNWETVVSGFAVFTSIDTSVKAAMIQMEFENVSSYIIRLGVIGRRSGSSTNRQFSLHFKPFDAFPSLLPIQLLNFETEKSNDYISLNWTTSMEVNNKLFEIQRRINQGEWYNIGQIPGSGTTFLPVSYQFTDLNPTDGEIEYRLRQIDYDEKFSYSNSVFVKWGTSFDNSWEVIPNPFNDFIEIKGLLSPQVSILNTLGQEELVSHNKSSIDVSILKPGLYYVKVSSRKGVEKVFKMKKE